MGGAGRFDGIVGKVTVVGRAYGLVNELDWTGSYSLVNH
jgi:hypothetical protein